jgi:multicomponent Na+:H+ antiporter subunit D
VSGDASAPSIPTSFVRFVVDPATAPALLLALPLLAAAVVRLPGVATRAVGYVIAVGTSFTVGGIALGLLPDVLESPAVHMIGGWEPRDGLVIGIPLVADGVAVGFIALAAVLVSAAVIYLHRSPERRPATLVLTLLLLGAAGGFVLAGDLLSMFVFLELFGVTVYAITAGKIEEPAALPATINIAVVSTTGAVLFLMGAGLLYRMTGTPNLVQAGQRLGEVEPGPALAVAVVLAVGGLAVKAGLVPFHFAHVDLDTVNWSPHAGLFGALMLPLGLYGIGRVSVLVLGEVPEAQETVRVALLVLATSTAIVAGVLCVLQDHLRRLLAFSSVAHLGIAGIGLGTLEPEGVAAAGLYVVGHGFVKVALFLAAGVVLHRLGTLRLGGLAGRGREVVGATALLAVGAPLLAGVPPSGLFVGKAGISEALETAGLSALSWVAYLSAALTAAALARFVAHLVRSWPVPDDDLGRVLEHQPDELLSATPRVLVAVPAVLLLAGAGMALVPGVLSGAGQAGAGFVEPAGYEAAVLGEPPPPAAEAPELEPFKPASVVEGAGITGVGLLLGLAVARWWRREQHHLTAPLRWLRRAHTGLVNDQMAWLSVAMAAWCVVVLVRLSG